MIHRLLRRRAVCSGESVALSLYGADAAVQHTTYEELDQRAHAIAQYLSTIASPGDRALLMYELGAEYVAALFGCFASGVIAVPMYPPGVGSPKRVWERLESVVKNAAPRVLLTDVRSRTEIEAGFVLRSSGQVRLVATDQLRASASTERAPGTPERSPHDAAILQFTSGSTGDPKGVVITHQNLADNSRAIRQKFGIEAGDSAMSWLPPYHDMGLVGGVIQPIFSGIPVALMSPMRFLKNPLSWLQVVSQSGSTISGAPNFAYDLCARRAGEGVGELDLSRWRLAFNGSEPINPATMRAFVKAFASVGFSERSFYSCYGLAECTLIVSGGFVRPEHDGSRYDRATLEAGHATKADAGDRSVPLVSCGSAIPGHDVCIVDPDGCATLPEQAIGEICVAGDSVCAGYWNAPAKSAEVTFERSGRRFLRTGDLGFLDSGELYVTGRKKDLIIANGKNHFPSDIEATVCASDERVRPGQVVAFGLFDERARQEAVVILAEVRAGHVRQAAIAHEIQGAIRQAVSSEHHVAVADVVIVPPGKLPKTTNGKPRRSTAKEAYLLGRSRARVSDL